MNQKKRRKEGEKDRESAVKYYEYYGYLLWLSSIWFLNHIILLTVSLELLNDSPLFT